MTEERRINCYKCKFFYVTWEPQHPNGCRAMGFKSKLLPSVVVYRSSGSPCQLFEEKKKRPRGGS
ncbi:MAG TPA: uracil-DNA glycosylase [Desulfobacteraceae bacterium]|nr:uracil-DNA glycosylase [Desulfobacteraceae bacterium]